MGADAAAVAWLLAIAAAYLAPAVRDGASFGPFDLGNVLSGLGHGLYTQVHNGAIGDQIEEFIPWNLFDWRQLHRLRFPLWNPYSGFGMPQFFNFQSSVLSLPDLVGYLLPARLSFLASVAVKLALAGAGAYFFGRVLGLSVLGAALAGTVYELGGPFVSEVGWPLADVMAWAGWILALTWLLLGRRPRARLWVCLLGLCVAFAVYGGFPEADLLLASAYVVVTGVYLAVGPRLRRKERRAAALAILAAWGIGLCLAAPLWLPGLQLLRSSARLALAQRPAIPLRALSELFLQGYYGYPLLDGEYFGPFSYYETVAYVGVAALVLAGVALQRCRRKPAALALTAMAGALALVGYDTGVFAFVTAYLPTVGALIPGRVRLPLSLAVGALAGFGLDELLSSWQTAATRRAYRVSLASVGAVVVGLLVRFQATRGLLAPTDADVRLHSFVWPLSLLAGMVLLDAASALATPVVRERGGRGGRHRGAGGHQHPAGDRAAPARRGEPGSGRPLPRWTRLALGCLVAAEAAFLLSAGIRMNAYSRRFFPQSAAERQLAGIVGDALVGFAADDGDPTRYGGLGLIPEMNVAYGIRELAVYDPMIPAAYFAGWGELTHQDVPRSGWFAPAVDSAGLARTLGVGYVLAPAGDGPAPPGMRFVADVGDERLYRVPGVDGAGLFSLQGGGSGDRIVSARQTGNAAWQVQVDARRPVTLIVRLTDVPGWHAESGGRALPLQPWNGLLQQVALPPGRRTVRIWYWPPLFSVGLVLCLVGALAVAGVGLSARLHAIFKSFQETVRGPNSGGMRG